MGKKTSQMGNNYGSQVNSADLCRGNGAARCGGGSCGGGGSCNGK